MTLDELRADTRSGNEKKSEEAPGGGGYTLGGRKATKKGRKATKKGRKATKKEKQQRKKSNKETKKINYKDVILFVSHSFFNCIKDLNTFLQYHYYYDRRI